MFLGLGAMEVLVILVLALVVLGPERLPQVAKQLARTLGELRRVGDDVRQQFDQEAEPPPRPPPPPRVSLPAAPPPAAGAAAAPPKDEGRAGGEGSAERPVERA